MEPLQGGIKIELPELQHGEPESLCRFCYSTMDLLSIFPSNGNPMQRVLDLLDQLIGITLSVGDDFPSAICRQCVIKLEDFDSFRRKCKLYSDEMKKLRLGSIEESSITIKYEDLWEQDEDVDLLTEAKEIKECGIEVKEEKPNTQELMTSDEKPVSIRSCRRGDDPSVKRLELPLAKSKPAVDFAGQTETPGLEQREYRCKICEEFFTDKDSVNNHLKKHMDIDKLRCCNCQKTSPTLRGLLAHAVKNYVITSFPCQHCDTLFKSRENLLAHELYCDTKIPKTQVAQDTVETMQCHLCPKTFETGLRLQFHLQKHELKVACNKCGSDFPNMVFLENHKARYHSDGLEQIPTTVRCEPCQRTFVDASAYRSHHTQVHQLNGDQTSRKFDEKKLYECDVCGKRFWSINTIRYHVLVHRKYRDCDQCSKSYRSDKELRKHKMKIHPVKCEFCTKKFVERRSLRAHCNRVHGMLQIKLLTENQRISYSWHKVMYKCACCEQEYEKYNQLKDHYDRKHPGAKFLIRCTKCDRNSTSIIGYMGHLTGNCGQTPKRMKAWH